MSILSNRRMKTSLYLKKEEFGTDTNIFNKDIDFVLYNDIYNNYLQAFLDADYGSIHENEELLETIIKLARAMDETISTLLLDAITVVQRGLLFYTENLALKQQIDTLKEELEDSKCSRARFAGTIETSVNVDVSIDLKYLYYIKEYGPPIEGLFDSRKLAKVIQKYDLYNV